jgi:sterol 3beta-glucosyltransferase
MQITILALGSRGDVQPLLALAVGLQLTGRHEVSFVTSNDFERVVRNHGVNFFSLGVNARELLGTEAAWDVLESGRNVIQGMWQIVRMMRPTLEQLVGRVWQASQTAEAIIFSTLGIGAYHIAEKLRLPCFWALPFPFFNRTRSFPNLAFPFLPLGGSYNLTTHIMVEQLAQQLTGRFINRWRQKQLGLPPISLFKWPYGQMDGRPVPMLYSYSPSVVPKPPDWDEHVHVTGYWFLDHSSDWLPPTDLVRFLEAGPPPVYVGFGSMSSRDPESTTEIVLKALKRSGQRGLVASGWGGLKSVDLPDGVFKLESVPHDWLFPRIAAVVHHGGAGTTAAGLRAGVPSVLVPHFGDQSFWARQVVRLGVGPKAIPRNRLTAQKLCAAIVTAITDENIQAHATALGERIRTEDGVGQAVEVVERGLATAE